MKTVKWLMILAVISMAMTSAVFAQTRTFRTPAAIAGVLPDTNVAGKPQYDFEKFAGHDLVNLALGTPLDTVRTNEVLALEFECDSSVARLVVYDKAASNNIATIATSSRIDILQQQGSDTDDFPNRERFVTLLDVATVGDGSNGLAGGFLTVAGRLHLDPSSGCPRAVRRDTDRRDDRFCGDPKATKDTIDKDRPKLRAGRGHFIGVLEMISLGTTNTVLVPAGTLNINRQLLP